MIQPFYRGDRYCTDKGVRRPLLKRLFLSSPHSFYLQILLIVLRARRVVTSGDWNEARWQASSVEVIRACENVGMTFEINGLNQLTNLGGPVVFISNHMSTLETFAFPGILVPFTHLTFVVKDSLAVHPIFGPIMCATRPVVVGRKNPREDLSTVLKEGTERIHEGYSMVIFPQSTRSEIFRAVEFNSLGVKLAARAGVPVVPVALRTDAWGNGKKLKEFGPVRPEIPIRISFGPVTPVKGKGGDEHEEVTGFIIKHLREWGVGVEV